jgi:hypothetical protein
MKMGEMPAYLDLFEELALPHLEEAGFRILGAWVTSIGRGQRSDLRWLCQWENLAEQEKCNNSYHRMPFFEDWAKKAAPHLTSAENIFMEPTTFSALQ